jgi:hypothetical protein
MPSSSSRWRTFSLLGLPGNYIYINHWKIQKPGEHSYKGRRDPVYKSSDVGISVMSEITSSKTDKTDEQINWNLFGETPRYLAAGLGMRPEPVLTYLASTLGGLAGPFARMDGFLGESHSPALPLILAVRHPGRARHLEQLAVEPVTHFNDWRRRHTQALFPDMFEKHHAFQGSKVKQVHLGLLDALDNELGVGDKIASNRTTLLHYRQNHQPSVMLTAPDPRTFDELRGSVFDENPLIVDTGGRLVRNAIQPHPRQKDWQALLERIVEGARGGIDQPAGPGGLDTLSSARRTRTPFLFHLPAELTAQTLLHPASANLLEVGVLLPTERIAGRLTPTAANYQQARQLLGRYQDAVNRVLWSRLDNSGVVLALIQPIGELIEGQDELEDRLDDLPSHIRRYCGGLYGLPLRLLWTALVLDDPKARNARALVPGVLQTARWCIESQITLITEALEAEQRRELEAAAVKMLEKLIKLRLPCKMAELQRKYHHQRKELLEPALVFLRDEGLATWDPQQNRIDLLPCGSPPEWLAALAPSSVTGTLTVSAHSPPEL